MLAQIAVALALAMRLVTPHPAIQEEAQSLIPDDVDLVQFDPIDEYIWPGTGWNNVASYSAHDLATERHVQSIFNRYHIDYDKTASGEMVRLMVSDDAAESVYELLIQSGLVRDHCLTTERGAPLPSPIIPKPKCIGKRLDDLATAKIPREVLDALTSQTVLEQHTTRPILDTIAIRKRRYLNKNVQATAYDVWACFWDASNDDPLTIRFQVLDKGKTVVIWYSETGRITDQH